MIKYREFVDGNLMMPYKKRYGMGDYKKAREKYSHEDSLMIVYFSSVYHHSKMSKRFDAFRREGAYRL